MKEPESLTHKYSRALVTGGSGFIGSHLTDRLLEEDFEVKVLDDLSSGHLENLNAHVGRSNFLFIKGDIRDPETVKTAVKDVDVVFHEAAFVGTVESIDKPLLANDINVNGTLNLLGASLRADVKRFILASSAAIYGEPKTVPIREDSVVYPNSPYAISKLATELYAKVYCQIYGLEAICLRYFNVYGPRQVFGSYGGVITAFVNSLIEDRRPTICGDGNQTRDFINVKDVVQANMLVMEKNCAGEVFNIGTGSSVTINSLLETVESVFGKQWVEPKRDAQRPHDIRRSCSDISRAKRILGFKPEVSLEVGLKDYIEYYRQMAHRS